jgi:hypothetical protein
MSFVMMRRLAAVGCAAVALTACADAGTAPTAPRTAPSLRPVVDPTTTVATGLGREVPLRSDLTVTRTIGPAGGTLRIKEAGIRVVVPEGAVDHDVAFTVTAVAGTMVAYEFGPHGLTFNRPLQAQQALRGTTWYRVDDLATLEIGYFRTRDDVDPAAQRASVRELLPLTLDLSNGKIRFDIQHFSGYMVSCGRHPSK